MNYRQAFCWSLRQILIISAFLLAIPVAAEQGKNHVSQDKTIGEVTIVVRDIFENPSNMFYRTANQLKISTRELTIREELLFESGDVYDSFTIEESERVLRSLGYLRDVRITEDHRPDGTVDITVNAQDTWTIIPQASFSSGDGRTKIAAGLAESNLLGLGKRVEVGYRSEEGSDTVQAVYDDRNLFGTDHQMQAAVFDGNDGETYLFDLGNPYRSLVQDEAWSTSFSFFDGLNRLWQNGDERYLYRAQRENYSLGYSFAGGKPETTLRRYTLGYSYRSNVFAQATQDDFDKLDLDPEIVSNDPAQLAEDRRFSGLYLGLEHIQQDFLSSNYIDRFERVEDFNLGQIFATSVILAPEFLGSIGDWVLWQGELSRGYRFSEKEFVRGEISGTTRYDGDSFERSIFHTEGRYYNVLGDFFWDDLYLGRHTLAGNIMFDYGEDLYRDEEFLLGADNGLRGYEAKTFTGNKRFLINLEERAHFAEDVWDLISIGSAAFIEAGGSTYGSLGNLFADDIYSDFGVGLRVGFPRSSGERVLRVDLAFPMRDGPDGSESMEIRVIFSGGQLFSSSLSSEVSAKRRASVDF